MLPDIPMVPLRRPALAGVKMTCNVQLAAAANVLPQFVAAMEKSPVMPIAMALIAMLVWLVRVIVCGELPEPSSWLPKLSEEGLTSSEDEERPVPRNETVCEPLASVTVKIPVCGPTWVGR